jgi:tetratricopeptide (TPR) repeat protein
MMGIGSREEPSVDDSKTTIESKGWQLFNEGKWTEAVIVFDELLAVDSTNEGGLQGKIACLRKLRSFSQAVILLDEALKTHPDSAGILSEKAWLSVEAKHYSDAIETFKLLLSRLGTNDQDAPERFSWLIGLLRLEQRFDEAEETMAEALRLFPNNYSLSIDRGWLYFYQNEFEQAAETFEAVLRTYAANPIALQGKIACLRVTGDWGEAKRQSLLAIQTLGRLPGVLNEMAWLSYEQSNYDEASELFQEVLAITPKDPYAHINLAWSLTKQGGTETLQRASHLCRCALSFEPNLPEARGCLGVVAFKQGRLGEAESQLRRSIATGAREGNYADLGALYIRMGRYEEAEQVLRKGLTIKFQEASLHLELGNLFLQTERIKDATAEFRQAIALNPKDPEPVRALAISLMEAGKLVGAESVLRNAIRTFDEVRRWRLHLTLCQVLAKVADEVSDSELFNEALKEAKLAVRLQPNHPDPHFVGGIVRFKMEDYQGALRCFRHCEKLDRTRVDAEINARRVKSFIHQDRIRSKLSASVILCVIMFTQLALLWWLRLKYGVDEKHAVVTSSMITVLVPVCLGLIVVSVLLPSLTKLKLTGLEAELSQPHPKEALASGPKGQIGFGGASLDTGGALAGLVNARGPEI